VSFRLSHDVKQFRLALKIFIISNYFYSLEEYFDINWKWVMFCYTGNTAPCKMACCLLILKLFLYLTCVGKPRPNWKGYRKKNLTCINFIIVYYLHFWYKFLTIYIRIYCMLLFCVFLYYYKNDYFHIL
jgi:hypothetical protein